MDFSLKSEFTEKLPTPDLLLPWIILVISGEAAAARGGDRATVPGQAGGDRPVDQGLLPLVGEQDQSRPSGRGACQGPAVIL